MNSSKSHISG
jgi:hypothetical protein